jgi:peptidoglycan/LPS O-acetylase OafA/YrhL
MKASKGEPGSVRFVDSSASLLFDLLRGCAALIVVLEHWRNILFIDYQQLPAHRALLMIPYLLSGAGRQAVVVFFLLSGFFIGGSVFSSVGRRTWQWGDYLLRRVVRLWVVLIPALLLCVGWDWLGLHLGHAPLLYHGGVANHLIGNVERDSTPSIFIGNLFFLQEIFTTTFGSDGALWSLAYEFWYYILFPLGYFAMRRGTRIVPRIVCAVLFLTTAGMTIYWRPIPAGCTGICFIVLHGVILAYFPIWLAGVALTRMPRPRFSGRTASWIRIAACVIYLPIFFGSARIHSLPVVVDDYILAGFTFGLLWILLSAKGSAPSDVRAHATRGLARFSYTLYVAHTPLLVFLGSLLVGDARWVPTLPRFLMALLPMSGILLYAYALAYFTEFQTDKIRKRLERLLGLHVTKPALPSDPAEAAAS